MPTYANKTTVTIAKSKVDIENLCMKYGATEYITGWNNERAMIMFTMKGFKARFEVPLPKENSFMYKTEWEQACRQIWRVLLLVLKAKFNVIEMECSTFEAEFMANILLPDNRTVGETVLPMIEKSYDEGTVMLQLPDYS